jgi:hypothetical protein
MALCARKIRPKAIVHKATADPRFDARPNQKGWLHFEAFWDEPTLIQPSGISGTNWSPMSYNPDTGFFYMPGTIRTSAFARYDNSYKKGKQYNGGTQAAPIGSATEALRRCRQCAA